MKFKPAALVANTRAGMVIVALVVSPGADAVTAKKTPAGKAAEPAACVTLHSDYEMASKRLALYSAQGAVAGGAAKVRAEQQSSNTLSEARMTLDLLRSNGCKVPTAAPSRDRYLMQGMQCVTDMIGARGRPDSCILENWTPEK